MLLNILANFRRRTSSPDLKVYTIQGDNISYSLLYVLHHIFDVEIIPINSKSIAQLELESKTVPFIFSSENIGTYLSVIRSNSIANPVLLIKDQCSQVNDIMLINLSPGNSCKCVLKPVSLSDLIIKIDTLDYIRPNKLKNIKQLLESKLQDDFYLTYLQQIDSIEINLEKIPHSLEELLSKFSDFLRNNDQVRHAQLSNDLPGNIQSQFEHIKSMIQSKEIYEPNNKKSLKAILERCYRILQFKELP